MSKSAETRPPGAATAAGLALVALGPVLSGMLSRGALRDPDPAARLELQLVLSWMTAAALVLLVLRWEKRDLWSVGIVRFQRGDPLLAAAGLVASGAMVFATMPLVAALGFDTLAAGVREIGKLPVPLRAVAAVTAGVTEEVLFRGFLVERLTSLTGRLMWGAAISWSLFTALHLPFWGVGGSIQIGAFSIPLYLIYMWRRSIVPCVLLHVANDLYAFLLVPLLIPQFP